MRICAIAVACVVLASCVAQSGSVTQVANAMWRLHTEHLASDRVVARACLTEGHDCASVVQQGCGLSEESLPVEQRLCDWRAIAAWEDELNFTLAALRARFTGTRALAELDASQRAWERSMIADVGIGMNHYEGGSLAGPVGAHIRALATAHRAMELNQLDVITDDGG